MLIIQEGSVEFPDASYEGGMLFFDFHENAPAVYEIGLQNIVGNSTYLTVVSTRGDTEVVEKIDVVGLGTNSVQNVLVNIENMSLLKVTLTGPGAVTSILGCFEPGTKPPSAVTPTQPGTTPTEAPPTRTQPAPTQVSTTPTNPAPTKAPTRSAPTPTQPGPTPQTAPTQASGPTQSPPTTGPPRPSTPAPTTTGGCANAIINFDTLADGTPLSGGRYVKKEWFFPYGLALSASGGFLQYPRLFDTSDIGNTDYDDSDLGSPNEKCSPPLVLALVPVANRVSPERTVCHRA